MIKGRLTYANVTSSIALFIALGGVSYAATALPSNSVGTLQIKEKAVTGAKLADGAVVAGKIGPGAVGVSNLGPGAQLALKGATGPAGTKGDKGVPGTPGAKGETGAAGARGPEGPRGETGPQGPAGSAAISVGRVNRPGNLATLTSASGSVIGTATSVWSGNNHDQTDLTFTADVSGCLIHVDQDMTYQFGSQSQSLPANIERLTSTTVRVHTHAPNSMGLYDSPVPFTFYVVCPI